MRAPVRLALAGLAVLALGACGGGSGDDADADATSTTAAVTTTTAAAPTTTADPGEAAAFAAEFAGAGFSAKEAACLGTAAAALTETGAAPSLVTEVQAFSTCDITDDRLSQLGLLERVEELRDGTRTAIADYFTGEGATDDEAECIADGAIDALDGAPLSAGNRHLLVPAIEACDVDPADVGF